MCTCMSVCVCVCLRLGMYFFSKGMTESVGEKGNLIYIALGFKREKSHSTAYNTKIISSKNLNKRSSRLLRSN